MAKDDNPLFACGAMVCIGLVLIPLLMVINGFTISCLWNWYLVPLGLKELGIIHAMGIGLFFAYVNFHSKEKSERKRETEEIVLELASIHAARPAVVLLIGFLLKGYI